MLSCYGIARKVSKQLRFEMETPTLFFKLTACESPVPLPGLPWEYWGRCSQENNLHQDVLGHVSRSCARCNHGVLDCSLELFGHRGGDGTLRLRERIQTSGSRSTTPRFLRDSLREATKRVPPLPEDSAGESFNN